MKFGKQHRQSGIEALAGSTRLKAPLQWVITGLDRQISSAVWQRFLRSLATEHNDHFLPD